MGLGEPDIAMSFRHVTYALTWQFFRFTFCHASTAHRALPTQPVDQMLSSVLTVVGRGLCLGPHRSSFKRSRSAYDISDKDDVYCHEEHLGDARRVANNRNAGKVKKVTFDLDEKLEIQTNRAICFTQENLIETSSIFTYFSDHSAHEKVDSEYYRSVFELQMLRRPRSDYMSWQVTRGLTRPQRAMLIKWLLHIGWSLQMPCEIILLSISYFERCLGTERMCEWHYGKMMCMTCIILACKMYGSRHDDDDHAQKLLKSDLHAFTLKELGTMEHHVLGWLEFDMVQPTTMTFIDMFLKELGILTRRTYLFCSFVAEFFAIEYESHKYLHSTIAEVIVKIAVKSFKMTCEHGAFEEVFFANRASFDCLEDVIKALRRERVDFTETVFQECFKEFELEQNLNFDIISK